MPLPTSEFLVNLAASLAYDLIKTTGHTLKLISYGDAESQAVERVYRRAFAELINEIFAERSEDEITHLEALLSHLVNEKQVAHRLLSLSLSEFNSSLEQYQDCLESVGLDLSTLPVDPDAALSALVEGLARALREESALPGSPLFNRACIGRLHAINVLLEKHNQTLATALETVRRLEGSLGELGEPALAPSRDIIGSLFLGANELQASQIVLRLAPDFHDLLEVVKKAIKEYPLRMPPSPVGPFNVPPLPEHFVARPELSEALKSRFISSRNEISPGVLVVSAVHGLAGIGKSTLTAALAHDPDVQRRFGDGILWVTLGQQPDLISSLSSWIQALGYYDLRHTSIEAASAQLRGLLRDRAMLLVVDDAWFPEHVTPFLVGSSKCQVVVTTRDALIAKTIHAVTFDLKVMTTEQALALIEGRLGRALAGHEPVEAKALAQTVGYLPLALELAAAQVADGIPWAELLHDLQAEIARLEVLDVLGAENLTDEASRKHLSLLASFNLSLRHLPEVKRRQLAWLGVLPEDATATPEMASTLWGLDVRHARDTLRYLRDKALLLPGPISQDGTATCRLHDLVLDLARGLLTSPPSVSARSIPGLGVPLAEAHNYFLTNYRRQAQDGLWQTLPVDGYIQAHLVWHLEQAGRVEEVHELLCEETPDGKNAWYGVRDNLNQTAGFIEDVMRARAAAASACDLELSGRNHVRKFSQEVRCALILTSLNSLAENIPPSLMVKLVANKVWSPAQGIAYAFQIPDGRQRTEALIELLPHVPEALHSSLAAVRTVEPLSTRIELLQVLAGRLRDIDLKEGAAQAERAALEVALAIEGDGERTKGLADVARWCAKTGEPSVAFSAACAIDDEHQRINTLLRIAAHLPEPLIRECFTRITSGGTEDWQKAIALAELAAQAPLDLRDEIVTAGIGFAESERDELQRASTFNMMLAKLSPPARTPDDNQLSPDVREEWQALFAVTQQKALAAARAITDDSWRRQALTHVIQYLPDDAKPSVVEETVALARAIADVAARARALMEVSYTAGERMGTDLLREAASLATEIGPPNFRADLLTTLSLRLAERGAAADVIETVRSIPRAFRHGQMMGLLCVRLAKNGDAEGALTVFSKINDEEVKEDVLDKLLSIIADEPGGTPAAPPEAMSIGAENRGGGLNHLDQLRALTDAIGSVRRETARAQLLIKLTAVTPADLLPDVLKLSDKLSNPALRSQFRFMAAIRYKDQGEFENAVEVAEKIGAFMLAELLPKLAAGMPEALLERLLEKINRATDRDSAGAALVGLAPHLPAPLHVEASLIADSLSWSSVKEIAMNLLSHAPVARRLTDEPADASSGRDIRCPSEPVAFKPEWGSTPDKREEGDATSETREGIGRGGLEEEVQAGEEDEIHDEIVYDIEESIQPPNCVSLPYAQGVLKNAHKLREAKSRAVVLIDLLRDLMHGISDEPLPGLDHFAEQERRGLMWTVACEAEEALLAIDADETGPVGLTTILLLLDQFGFPPQLKPASGNGVYGTDRTRWGWRLSPEFEAVGYSLTSMLETLLEKILCVEDADYLCACVPRLIRIYPRFGFSEKYLLKTVFQKLKAQAAQTSCPPLILERLEVAFREAGYDEQNIGEALTGVERQPETDVMPDDSSRTGATYDGAEDEYENDEDAEPAGDDEAHPAEDFYLSGSEPLSGNLRNSHLAKIWRHLIAAGHVDLAILAVGEIKDRQKRDPILGGMVAMLLEMGRQADALDVAERIREPYERARVFISLAERLPSERREKIVISALEEITQITELSRRTILIDSLVSSLSSSTLQRALDAARTVGDHDDVYLTTIAIAEHLNRTGDTAKAAEVLRGVPKDFMAFTDEQTFADAPELISSPQLIEDIEYGEPPVMEGRLALLRTLLMKYDSEEALQALFEYSKDMFKGISADNTKSHVQAAISARFAELQCFDRAFECWREIRDSSLKVALLPEWNAYAHFTVAQRDTILKEALACPDIGLQVDAVGALVPYLGLAQLESIFFNLRSVAWPAARARLITSVAPYLSESLLMDALVTAIGIDNGEARGEALVGLAPYLSETLLRLALAAVKAMGSEEERAAALAGLSTHLPDALKADVRGVLESIKDENTANRALSWLIPAFGEAELLEIYSKVSGDEAQELRRVVMPPLVERLAQLGHAGEAMTELRRIKSAEQQMEMLSRITPFLPEAFLQDALELARDAGFGRYGGTALVELAPRLAELGHPGVALKAARDIEDDALKARVLVKLCPLLPADALLEAFEAAKEIVDAEARDMAVNVFCVQLAKQGFFSLAVEAIWIINDAELRERTSVELSVGLVNCPRPVLCHELRGRLEFLSGSTRKDLLCNLRTMIPLLPLLGGRDILGEIHQAIQDTARWWP